MCDTTIEENCLGNFTYSGFDCSCKCLLTADQCNKDINTIEIFDAESCACVPTVVCDLTCDTGFILNMDKESKDFCTCSCDESQLRCKYPYIQDIDTCSCNCGKTSSSCRAPYTLNYYACECQCDLTCNSPYIVE